MTMTMMERSKPSIYSFAMIILIASCFFIHRADAAAAAASSKIIGALPESKI
jgi:hypothetical protein